MKTNKERKQWEKDVLKRLKEQRKEDARQFRTDKTSDELKKKTKKSNKEATSRHRVISIYFDPTKSFGNHIMLTTSDGIMKRLHPGEDLRYHSFSKRNTYYFTVDRPDGKGNTTKLKTLINKKFVTRITLNYDYGTDKIKVRKQICDDEKGMLPQENLPGLIAMWAIMGAFMFVTVFFIWRFITG